MRAKDVMSDGVMSLGDDATVHEATELLVNTGVSAMPVLDKDGMMIGIVSEGDLVGHAKPEAWLQKELGAEPSAASIDSRLVTEVMTKNVITADENAPLSEVAELMSTHRVKRLPIVSGKSVVGIVSRVDLLKALLSRRPAKPVFVAKSNPAPLSAGEQLRRAVVAALQGHSWSVARRADVAVNGDVAHLWGVVPSIAVLDAYRAAAAAVPGVKSVEVHMHVLPPVR